MKTITITLLLAFSPYDKPKINTFQDAKRIIEDTFPVRLKVSNLIRSKNHWRHRRNENYKSYTTRTMLAVKRYFRRHNLYSDINILMLPGLVTAGLSDSICSKKNATIITLGDALLHEVGHALGATHDTGVMSIVAGNSTEFSEKSKVEINNCLGGK